MISKTALAGLTLTVLALAGCGGGSDTPAASAAPASSSAPSSSAVASTPAPSPSDSAAPGTGAAATIADPCDVLDAGQIEALTGVKVKKGSTQSVGVSKVCTWYPEDGTKSNAAVFSGQEGPLQGSLSQVEGQLKTEFDGKVSALSVAGADDARYVTGTKSGLNVIDVIAQKDDRFYQVLAASPRDASQHKGAAIKIAETLIKA
ncbi:MAG: DUF3558 family protein [Janthinobacterium lividum]